MPNKTYLKTSRQVPVDEKGFELPLNMIVEGRDKSGETFQEKTLLSYISHNGSSFFLKTPVAMGNELKLIIDLPPNLSQNENLKLIIKGKVVFLEAPKDHSQEQRISLNFENKYVITSEKDT